MRTLPLLLLAALVSLPFVPLAAAEDETRVMVFCDPAECPGFNAGDRDTSCVGPPSMAVRPCSYGDWTNPTDGVGIGAVVRPTLPLCEDNPYCYGVAVVNDRYCVGGKAVRAYGFPLSRAVNVGACEDTIGFLLCNNIYCLDPDGLPSTPIWIDGLPAGILEA